MACNGMSSYSKIIKNISNSIIKLHTNTHRRPDTSLTNLLLAEEILFGLMAVTSAGLFSLLLAQTVDSFDLCHNGVSYGACLGCAHLYAFMLSGRLLHAFGLRRHIIAASQGPAVCLRDPSCV